MKKKPRFARKNYTPHHGVLRNLTTAELNLALVYVKQGRLNEALHIYDDCEHQLESMPDAYQVMKTVVQVGRAVAYLQFNALEEAEECTRKAMDLLKGDKSRFYRGRQDAFNFLYHNCLMMIDAKRGNRLAMRSHFEEMLSIVRQYPDAPGISATWILCQTARHYLCDQPSLQDAEPILETAYVLARRHPENPDAALVVDTYALLLEQTNRTSEISDMRRWIRHTEFPVLQALPGVSDNG
jgi:tetratricopeptide (TPR) repeat protein